jgi:large subunit ribosomal protein L9
LLASSPAISVVEAQRKISARNQQQTEAEIAEMANQLDGREIFLKAQAGVKDRLYGSITNADIAAELENAAGLVVDKRKIELAKPIHQLGSYDVTIRLAKNVIPKIKVTITEKETD